MANPKKPNSSVFNQKGKTPTPQEQAKSSPLDQRKKGFDFSADEVHAKDEGGRDDQAAAEKKAAAAKAALQDDDAPIAKKQVAQTEEAQVPKEEGKNTREQKVAREAFEKESNAGRVEHTGSSEGQEDVGSSSESTKESKVVREEPVSESRSEAPETPDRVYDEPVSSTGQEPRDTSDVVYDEPASPKGSEPKDAFEEVSETKVDKPSAEFTGETGPQDKVEDDSYSRSDNYKSDVSQNDSSLIDDSSSYDAVDRSSTTRSERSSDAGSDSIQGDSAAHFEAAESHDSSGRMRSEDGDKEPTINHQRKEKDSIDSQFERQIEHGAPEQDLHQKSSKTEERIRNITSEKGSERREKYEKEYSESAKQERKKIKDAIDTKVAEVKDRVDNITSKKGSETREKYEKAYSESAKAERKKIKDAIDTKVAEVKDRVKDITSEKGSERREKYEKAYSESAKQERKKIKDAIDTKVAEVKDRVDNITSKKGSETREKYEKAYSESAKTKREGIKKAIDEKFPGLIKKEGDKPQEAAGGLKDTRAADAQKAKFQEAAAGKKQGADAGLDSTTNINSRMDIPVVNQETSGKAGINSQVKRGEQINNQVEHQINHAGQQGIVTGQGAPHNLHGKQGQAPGAAANLHAQPGVAAKAGAKGNMHAAQQKTGGAKTAAKAQGAKKIGGDAALMGASMLAGMVEQGDGPHILSGSVAAVTTSKQVLGHARTIQTKGRARAYVMKEGQLNAIKAEQQNLEKLLHSGELKRPAFNEKMQALRRDAAAKRKEMVNPRKAGKELIDMQRQLDEFTKQIGKMSGSMKKMEASIANIQAQLASKTLSPAQIAKLNKLLADKQAGLLGMQNQMKLLRAKQLDVHKALKAKTGGGIMGLASIGAGLLGGMRGKLESHGGGETAFDQEQKRINALDAVNKAQQIKGYADKGKAIIHRADKAIQTAKKANVLSKTSAFRTKMAGQQNVIRTKFMARFRGVNPLQSFAKFFKGVGARSKALLHFFAGAIKSIVGAGSKVLAGSLIASLVTFFSCEMLPPGQEEFAPPQQLDPASLVIGAIALGAAIVGAAIAGLVAWLFGSTSGDADNKSPNGTQLATQGIDAYLADYEFQHSKNFSEEKILTYDVERPNTSESKRDIKDLFTYISGMDTGDEATAISLYCKILTVNGSTKSDWGLAKTAAQNEKVRTADGTAFLLDDDGNKISVYDKVYEKYYDFLDAVEKNEGGARKKAGDEIKKQLVPAREEREGLDEGFATLNGLIKTEHDVGYRETDFVRNAYQSTVSNKFPCNTGYGYSGDGLSASASDLHTEQCDEWYGHPSKKSDQDDYYANYNHYYVNVGDDFDPTDFVTAISYIKMDDNGIPVLMANASLFKSNDYEMSDSIKQLWYGEKIKNKYFGNDYDMTLATWTLGSSAYHRSKDTSSNGNDYGNNSRNEPEIYKTRAYSGYWEYGEFDNSDTHYCGDGNCGQTCCNCSCSDCEAGCSCTCHCASITHDFIDKKWRYVSISYILTRPFCDIERAGSTAYSEDWFPTPLQVSSAQYSGGKNYKFQSYGDPSEHSSPTLSGNVHPKAVIMVGENYGTHDTGKSEDSYNAPQLMRHTEPHYVSAGYLATGSSSQFVDHNDTVSAVTGVPGSTTTHQAKDEYPEVYFNTNHDPCTVANCLRTGHKAHVDNLKGDKFENNPKDDIVAANADQMSENSADGYYEDPLHQRLCQHETAYKYHLKYITTNTYRNNWLWRLGEAQESGHGPTGNFTVSNSATSTGFGGHTSGTYTGDTIVANSTHSTPKTGHHWLSATAKAQMLADLAAVEPTLDRNSPLFDQKVYDAVVFALDTVGAYYSQGDGVDSDDSWAGYGRGGPESYDCSGFVWTALERSGLVTRDQRPGGWLPTVSSTLSSGVAQNVANAADLKPGDFLAYTNPPRGHIVLYIGGGKVVHASGKDRGVIIGDVNSFLNSSDGYAAYTVPH